MLHNMAFPKGRKLASVMLYATDRCNARCKHCYIWEKNTGDFISLDQVKALLNSKAIATTTSIGLEGGEFVLHPQAEAIMEYLCRHHPNFDLLSNCVHAGKLVTLIRKYAPKRLYVSLDGKPATHNSMRRVKGLYPKVIRVIEELKDTVDLSVMFTLTPFNSFEDLEHVASVCQKNHVDMRIGIYNNMEYFQTREQASEDKTALNYRIEDIPSVVKEFDENYDFMLLYHLYRRQEVHLSCNSIKDNIVIYPNGDVPLCQNRQIVLGNIREEPLDVIMTKDSTLRYHKEFHRCNGCWINFHRKYDIVLYRNLEKFLPRRVICKLLGGDYSWSGNPAEKYKDLVCKHYHRSSSDI